MSDSGRLSGRTADDGANGRAHDDAQRRWCELFAHLPDSVALIDVTADSRYLFAAINPAFERTFGVGDAQLAGHDVAHMPAVELSTALLAAARRSSADGGEVRLDQWLPTPAGPRRFAITLIPVIDDARHVYRFIAIERDVTERTEAARQLALREREFRALAENTHDFIVRWDHALRRLYVNPAFARAVGVPAERLIGTPIGAGPVSPPGDRTKIEFPVLDHQVTALLVERIGQVFRSGEPATVEMSVPSSAGRRFAHVVLVAERDERGAVASVLGIGRDVTELKRRERDLRLLADNSPDLIARFDCDGRCLFVNAAVEHVAAIPTAQLIGRPIEALGFDRRGRRLRRVGAALRAALAGAATEGRALNLELRLAERDGAHTYGVSVVPERESGEHVTSVLMIGRDITAHKKAEAVVRQLNLKLELRVAERTAALAAANRELETFAYSVSHDLKAPLRWIDGYSRLLQEGFSAGLGDEGRLFVDNVRRAALHMNELIDDLLSYSRIERQRMQPATIALDGLVRSAMEEWTDELRRLQVEIELTVAPISVHADRQALIVVLRNLIGNALKFSVASTPPRLEIGAREERGDTLLWVRDNGIGFDMKFHDRIFEIFQRLQRAEDYPGTGIGLALVRRAVARMGGRVWAESAPGAGACFFVRLPR